MTFQMMKDNEPLPQLIRFIQSELIGDEAISEDENLLGGGLIDSMGIMRLVAFLESDFGLSVPPEDVTIEHFESPRTISDYIRSARADERPMK